MGDHGSEGHESQKQRQGQQKREPEHVEEKLADLRQRLLRPAMQVPASARAEHERDHALVLDLMEYLCYAIKPEPSFAGSMTFVFDQELDEDLPGGGAGPRGGGGAKEAKVKPELELTVTIEKVDPDVRYDHLTGAGAGKGLGASLPRRPRVLVTLGGPPPGAEKPKGKVRVPYKQFLQIYSGKASAKDIASLAMARKVELTGFAAFMQFGLSFDYGSASWDGYYDIKSSLGGQGLGDSGDYRVERLKGQEGKDGSVRVQVDNGNRDAVDGSPTVLFSSDGFRELERYTAEARSTAAGAAAARSDEEPTDDDDGDDDDDSGGREGGGEPPPGGGGGGGGAAGEGWTGRLRRQGRTVAGWIRSFPGGGSVFGERGRGSPPGFEAPEGEGRGGKNDGAGQNKRRRYSERTGEMGGEAQSRHARWWRLEEKTTTGRRWRQGGWKHKEREGNADADADTVLLAALPCGITSRIRCLMISDAGLSGSFPFHPFVTHTFCDALGGRGVSSKPLRPASDGNSSFVQEMAALVPHSSSSVTDAKVAVGVASGEAERSVEAVVAGGESVTPPSPFGNIVWQDCIHNSRRHETKSIELGSSSLATIAAVAAGTTAAAVMGVVIGTHKSPRKYVLLSGPPPVYDGAAHCCVGPRRYKFGARRYTSVSSSAISVAVALAAAAGVQLNGPSSRRWIGSEPEKAKAKIWEGQPLLRSEQGLG